MLVGADPNISQNTLVFNTELFQCGYMSTRTYDSTRRRAMAEDTRAAVLAAAAELFATRGWATGMRDIARTARVSVETVYATAGSKGDLLLRVIDIGVVGDDDPVPMSERPQFLALGRGSRTERVAAAARLIAESNQRVAALQRTFAHAAGGDPELAARWRESEASQREQYAQGVRMVLGRKPGKDLVDGIWALGSTEVYLQLTGPAGWSPEKYRRWLADRIGQLLPEETS
jgi:AcrR family transcriptional regulator